jgi:hypothetical protein
VSSEGAREPWQVALVSRLALIVALLGNAAAVAFAYLIALSIPDGTSISHGEAMMGPPMAISLVTLAFGIPFTVVAFRLGRPARGIAGLMLGLAPFFAFALAFGGLAHWKGLVFHR